MADNPAIAIAPVAAPENKEFKASLYGSTDPLPKKFVDAVQSLQIELEMPVWMIIHNGEGEWGDINERVYSAIHGAKSEIESEKPIGLLLHSYGGMADEAYKIIRLFQRRTTGLTIMVPCRAKSAATLMALGGKTILMGKDADLGPLDVQLWDTENEEYDSALNVVQSFDRLNAYALTALDQAMNLLLGRTGKKADTLLPLALQYATNMLEPLLEKVDAITLTRKSRELKVAADYSIRLMKANYPFAVAERIASALVERYSTHGFVIDRTEAKALEKVGANESFGLGLKIGETMPSVELAFDSLLPFLDKLTVIGRLKEITK